MTAQPRDGELTMPHHEDLRALLQSLRLAAHGDTVTLEQLLARVGRQSFAAILLVISLLVVSPLSGIPGFPALMALIVFMVVSQALVRRQSLWLPRRIMRKTIQSDKLLRALAMLERPASWLDAHRSGRLSLLTYWPFGQLGYLVILLVALSWPPLSLIPFSATAGAIGLSLISAGLVLRDGIFMMLGYTLVGVIYGGGAMVLMGLF